MSIINVLNGSKMSYRELMTRDRKSYRMLPNDSKVWFKELDFKKNIKNVDEIKGPGRIIKQYIRWDDIEYNIEYPLNSNKIVLSKASVIYLSKP